MMRAIERTLFAIGIAGLGWYATAHIEAAREQAALSRELEEAGRMAASQKPQPTQDPKQTTTSTTSSTTTTTTTTTASPKVATRALIGRIEVKRLKLSAVAREGVDMRTLRGAIGHVPGTAFPGQRGNAAFAAHRDTFFRPLKDIRTGDEVVVTTPSAIHHYAVVSTQIVDPKDVWVLNPNGDASLLTLVTCYPFDYIGNAPKRFIVQASLQQTTPPPAGGVRF